MTTKGNIDLSHAGDIRLSFAMGTDGTLHATAASPQTEKERFDEARKARCEANAKLVRSTFDAFFDHVRLAAGAQVRMSFTLPPMRYGSEDKLYLPSCNMVTEYVAQHYKQYEEGFRCYETTAHDPEGGLPSSFVGKVKVYQFVYDHINVKP
jgi:hypothetical protein